MKKSAKKTSAKRATKKAPAKKAKAKKSAAKRSVKKTKSAAAKRSASKATKSAKKPVRKAAKKAAPKKAASRKIASKQRKAVAPKKATAPKRNKAPASKKLSAKPTKPNISKILERVTGAHIPTIDQFSEMTPGHISPETADIIEKGHAMSNNPAAHGHFVEDKRNIARQAHIHEFSNRASSKNS